MAWPISLGLTEYNECYWQQCDSSSPTQTFHTHTHKETHTRKPYTGTHTHRLTQAHKSTHPHIHTLARSIPLSPVRSLSSSIMKRHVFYILQIILYVIYGSGALLQYTFGKSNPNNMVNGNLDKGTKGSNNTAMHSFCNITGYFSGVCGLCM